MEKLITESVATVKGFVGADRNAVIETERIDMSLCHKLRFVVRLETGVATTAVFKCIEHDAASAGNSADLVNTLPHYVRIDGVDCKRKASTGIVNIAVTEADIAAGFVFIEVDKADLTDGFGFVSLEAAASGALRQSVCSVELETGAHPAYKLSI